jgi:mono/diheme cytochrome c family protein
MSHSFCSRSLVALFAAVGLLLAAGCRGDISEKPPIHPVLDMDFQAKVKAQTASEFAGFTDGRGMRIPPAGTVARGSLTDDPLDVWKDAGGNYLQNPVPVSMDVLRRGQERFNIYCAVCHDRSGSGNGLALQRANAGAFNPNVPHLGTEPRLRDQVDGYFYEVIRNGFGTMPAYGHQVSVHDRWAIVHYVRALQEHYE